MRRARLPLAILVTLVAVSLGTAAQPCQPFCTGSSDLAVEGASGVDDDGPDQATWGLAAMAMASLVALVTARVQRDQAT